MAGEARGFNTLVRAHDVLGPYLGILAGLKQAWAEANRDLLIRFLRAYATKALRSCTMKASRPALALRSKFGVPRRMLTDPAPYYDARLAAD